MPTQNHSESWQTQVVSDVIRDGLGVELLDSEAVVVAEIFRSDAEHRVTLRLFRQDLPPAAIACLMARAEQCLDPFDDGTPLTQGWMEAARAQASWC